MKRNALEAGGDAFVNLEEIKGGVLREEEICGVLSTEIWRKRERDREKWKERERDGRRGT
jgi:hypothetical protein